MDPRARVEELARIEGAPTPVLSVYLNTRWGDEHQRERVRVFLKAEIARVRKGPTGARLAADLNWIQAQGASLIEQALFPDANGVVLFACEALGLREVIPARVSFENAFVVAERPFLRPLAALLEQTPSGMVVFVDARSARLIPLKVEGPGEEVTLESEVPGHHRRGGWAQLAQSRYQRHIQDHRGRHFEAVTQVLVELSERDEVERIVMAGEPRTLAAFEKHLPLSITRRIVGTVSGARHDAPATFVSRASELLSHLEGGERAAALDTVLTEAAKSRQAVAGLAETLEAVSRGAVHRLYLLTDFGETGRLCRECGAFQHNAQPGCALCGSATEQTELGEAIVQRVLATGGQVETVDAHQGLAEVGGVAALLRYPL